MHYPEKLSPDRVIATAYGCQSKEVAGANH